MLRQVGTWIAASSAPAASGTSCADRLESFPIQTIARKGLLYPGVLRDDEIQAICRSVLAYGPACHATAAAPSAAPVSAGERPVADRPVPVRALATIPARPMVQPSPTIQRPPNVQDGVKRRYRLYTQSIEQG